jgi:four helix bundle protein
MSGLDRRERIIPDLFRLISVESKYLEMQSRMTRFGSDTYPLIKPLKEAGLPASVVDQLVRSATGVGSNFAEARGAESKADFLHKLQLALKECREAKNWLDSARSLTTVPQAKIAALYKESDELCAILYASVLKAKQSGTSGKGP